jgi:hypothetical protein
MWASDSYPQFSSNIKSISPISSRKRSLFIDLVNAKNFFHCRLGKKYQLFLVDHGPI